MRSAFPTDRSLTAHVAVLGAILLAPVILYVVGPPPRPEVYKLHEKAGPVAAMGHEIFGENAPLDFLFFGSSILRAAVTPPIIEGGLRTASGRKPEVLVCGPNWPGMDIQYLMLMDFLSHRHVHYLVLNVPHGVQETNKPHIVLGQMLRFGEVPAFTDGLSAMHKAQVYASEILGAPRQFLTLMRPNLVGAYEVHRLDSPEPEKLYGYYGERPVCDDRHPPAVSGQDMLHDGTADGGWFRFGRDSIGDYQVNMLRKIGALAAKKGVHVVMLNVPVDSDRGRSVVRERLDWNRVLGMNVTVLGIPSAVLFGNMSDEEFRHFYVDQHLNLNGRKYYTNAILPGLQILFDRIHATN